ncbi:MAG: hypothetical protein IT582_09615 [Opitutaceae bacterium]|nr:hypothetical protein [Opitutaceae bacterium]
MGILFTLSIGCTLISRTGYPWWLGLLMVVPLANVGLMLFLLLRSWPVEEELAERRLATGAGVEEDAKRVMALAGRRARQGRKSDAARLYQLIEQQLAGSVVARDAAIARGQLGGAA